METRSRGGGAKKKILFASSSSTSLSAAQGEEKGERGLAPEEEEEEQKGMNQFHLAVSAAVERASGPARSRPTQGLAKRGKSDRNSLAA